jgi:hypothetical protein
MKKEPNKFNKFKSPCILLMNSHLILSLKPICSTPFPSQNFIEVEGFVWSFGKGLVVPRYHNQDTLQENR